MPARKGTRPPNAGKGRRRGSSNKDKRDFRIAVTKLIEDNSQNFDKWLTSVAGQDPARALDVITRLAEYVTPKLQRTELSGPDGGALTIASTVRFVDADAKSKD